MFTAIATLAVRTGGNAVMGDIEKRFPFDAYPKGWFQVTHSSDVDSAQVVGAPRAGGVPRQRITLDSLTIFHRGCCPLFEGDQQARCIDGAAGGWLHSARPQKKPRQRERG